MSSQAKEMSVASKPKGRPPLEPRIAALETHIASLHNDINYQIDQSVKIRITVLEKALNETAYRLEQLELRFKQYRVDNANLAKQHETMTHDTIYEPVFTTWPGQSER